MVGEWVLSRIGGTNTSRGSLVPRRKSKITTRDGIACTSIAIPDNAFDAYNTAVEAGTLYTAIYIIYKHKIYTSYTYLYTYIVRYERISYYRRT